MATVTPMMRQYLDIKSQYPDAILFFRLGDFYEMFMEDAVVASRVLDITLTSRNKGSDDEIPLCGIPYHSSQPYIAKLVDGGHKVAVCEQVEDPRNVKGIVKREVVRVVTPGLVVDSDNLQPKENNFLMTVAAGSGEMFGIGFVDITTGDFRVTEMTGIEGLRSEMASIGPTEVLLPEGEIGDRIVKDLAITLDGRSVNRLPEWVWEGERAEGLLKDFFAVSSLEAFGCAQMTAGIQAAGAVIHYLQQTQKSALPHLRSLSTYLSTDAMTLDDATRRNLELTANLQDGKKRGSLLGILDRTVTAMGGRKLRHWINYPLVDTEGIRLRQGAIGEFKESTLLRHDLSQAMDGIYDLERLNTKVSMGNANAKDLVALKNSLLLLPEVLSHLGTCCSGMLDDLQQRMDPLEDVAQLLQGAITDDPPFVLREGGLIREGFHEELDELLAISRQGKGWIARLEAEEKERTGIGSLKVRYNKVFGYYIEVTKTHLDRVPENYERKQTLANAERYVTPALKEYESKVLTAEERSVSLEYDLFQQVRQQVAMHGQRIQETADALATVDVLLGLAGLAHERDYFCPQIDESDVLTIEEGRHPVIEAMHLGEPFIGNDVELDTVENQILIITGPNMAGKSTFMRQVALIVLMAQMGSFVPAKSARVGLVDRIFTRVGASDNLARGLSTFMVEMTETANILNHATDRSLIVLDEIGRGTSTFDGVSIAWAVAEYLHDHPQVAAKTLFATHYHELTDLSLTRERVQNYNVAVKEWNDQIIFLRKIVKGGTSHSYGIQVARLAGLPQAVIDRAREVLKNLESGEFEGEGQPRLAKGAAVQSAEPPPQLSLFDAGPDMLRERLKDVDISMMTPLDALNLLNDLKKLA